MRNDEEQPMNPMFPTEKKLNKTERESRRETFFPIHIHLNPSFPLLIPSSPKCV